jgi:hypothetical protein
MNLNLACGGKTIIPTPEANAQMLLLKPLPQILDLSPVRQH